MTTCYELGFSFSQSLYSSPTTDLNSILANFSSNFLWTTIFSFSLLSAFEWIYLRPYTLFTLPRTVLHSTVSSYRQIAHATNLFLQSHMSMSYSWLFWLFLGTCYEISKQASERAFCLFLQSSPFALVFSLLDFLFPCYFYLLLIVYLVFVQYLPSLRRQSGEGLLPSGLYSSGGDTVISD
jgi:hypothetical protein